MSKFYILLALSLLSLPMYAQWGNISPATGQVMDMMFLNEDTGFVAISNWNANTGDVYRTTDKGDNWTKIFTMTGSLKSVYFLSYNEGYIATGTDDICQRTMDGGASWVPFNSIMFNYGKLRFRDATYGFGLNGGSADVSYTRDGGSTWASYPIGRFAEGIDDYSSPNSNAAFVMTWNGIVYKSTNDTSWTYQSQLPGAKGIDFIDENIGYLITQGQLYETSDGGVNWNSISTNGGYDIAYAGNTLYLVDGSASIRKSTDGGLSFSQMTGTNNNIEDVQIIGNEAYAFGPVYRLGASTGPVGVNDLSNAIPAIALYPNPAKGNFSIDLGEQYENINVQITDLTGREVASYSFSQSEQIDLEIDEAPGVYLVIVNAGDKQSVVRFVYE
ncbi:MAG: photosystem II stability/assembly factor-like uncharacterized protein [Chitinophagales bacterium]|jgi:photosystem II stability/assembly factor-like uncharacterized protein